MDTDNRRLEVGFEALTFGMIIEQITVDKVREVLILDLALYFL